VCKRGDYYHFFLLLLNTISKDITRIIIIMINKLQSLTIIIIILFIFIFLEVYHRAVATSSVKNISCGHSEIINHYIRVKTKFLVLINHKNSDKSVNNNIAFYLLYFNHIQFIVTMLILQLFSLP